MSETYSEEYLATLDPEVRDLALSQQSDDVQQVNTQRFGGERTFPMTDVYDLEGDLTVPDNTQEFIDGVVEAPQSDNVHVVQAVLEALPPHLAETYRLVYMDQLTLREAGDELGIAFTSVRSRLQTIYGLVGKAVIAAGEDAL